MRINPRRRGRTVAPWLAGILGVTLLVAACGDGTAATTVAEEPGETTAGTDAPAGDMATISLAVNPWTASALNVEVAKQIIESELGNPVEVVSIDENTMFTGMSDGTLDAALEIGPPESPRTSRPSSMTAPSSTSASWERWGRSAGSCPRT